MILTVVFVVILHYEKNEVKRFEDATDQYIVCENAARQLQDGSDYLTEQVRLYAMTGERNYLDQYFEEADVTKRREQALESLKKYFDKINTVPVSVSGGGFLCEVSRERMVAIIFYSR